MSFKIEDALNGDDTSYIDKTCERNNLCNPCRYPLCTDDSLACSVISQRPMTSLILVDVNTVSKVENLEHMWDTSPNFLVAHMFGIFSGCVSSM